MAPTVDVAVHQDAAVNLKSSSTLNAASEPTVEPATTTYPRPPLKLTGALDHLKYFDNTPVIGREYHDVLITDLLHASNSDELLRELAITISQRGVVYFRKQNLLDTNDLKLLVDRLGKLAGKPESSRLHIHPVINAGREGFGGSDNEISKISSELNKKLYADKFFNRSQKSQSLARHWHSDITFEPVPSDYAVLQIYEKPPTGGDTLWASGYELYDKFSKPVQEFLDKLTATYAQPAFNQAAKNSGFKVYSEPRGSPENVGEELTAIHPVIRTNPVTGWKSVYAVGHHVAYINDLTERESARYLEEFVQLITNNHDLQVRFRWEENDIAIWDNRSVYHAATPDVKGVRTGNRAVSLGERPYFDPASKSRREALGEPLEAQI
ncbi:taurine catabolism dioxygenase [Ascobolus immersus RN42]|uniref:Taurine catabolism dioxygenase n=1 Tax=Ascobolus immersus RN42 TaxID=1160509 RepID=A0A3N4HP54_ASCIM|nr:taurine catabolism dioxygenase [Ascobolus immersus RN42]